MAESALAERSRFGRRETLHPSERTLCLGQKRWPATKGNGHAATAIGAPVVQAARDAAQFAFTRSVAATDWGREERSRPGLQLRHDSIAWQQSSGHARQLSLSAR